MVKINQLIKLQKADTPKSIPNIGKSWKDLIAYQFCALTRQYLKTENNKLNIKWYTLYLMKSTFETIWLCFSQARHFIRLCTNLHASGFGLPPQFEHCILYIYIKIVRRAWRLIIYVIKGKLFNKLLLCCLKENTIGQYNTKVAG